MFAFQWGKCSKVELCNLIAASNTIKIQINQSTASQHTCTSIVVAIMDAFKIFRLLLPVISGNKLNIYCIYIKNYTVVERGWCLFYWGAPRGEVSPDQFPCLVTPARGCLENACTAKLIQKRIHNLGGFKQFCGASVFLHLHLLFRFWLL